MTLESEISEIFKTEYGKMVAVLCKSFGLSHIETAEDIVSDTFLLASETWGKKGIPDSPVGWLYAIAKNKVKDQLKRKILFSNKIAPALSRLAQADTSEPLDFSEVNIFDSQLKMIFAICHPAFSTESQITLGLRILCGFGINQIASAFLTNPSTINKRLYRGKELIRQKNLTLNFPPESALPVRLESVLSMLYLLFNEGYYSAAENEKLNKDLCLEALRLTHLLTCNPLTNLPETNALIALICFHSSRFEARRKDVLYYEQNHNLWDQDLIRKGEEFLNKSSSGKTISKYHLEAAIGFWHTQNESKEKWENILQLYNYLLQIAYSPITALNRTYALSKANSRQEAIIEAKKINLDSWHLYHCLLADFYLTFDKNKSKEHLNTALSKNISERDRSLILGKINHLNTLISLDNKHL